MNEIVKFLKEIFMLKTEDSIKVGLTQFKSTTPIEKSLKKKPAEPKKEVKLSDLMRRSYWFIKQMQQNDIASNMIE